MRTLALTSLCLTLMTSSHAIAATIIAQEDFDGGALNVSTPLATPGIDDSASGPGDMFGVRSRSTIVNGFGLPFVMTDDSVQAAAGNTVNPDDTTGLVGQAKTDNFFGGVDEDAYGPLPAVATISFDISSATQPLTLSVDIGGMSSGFEADDFLRFEYAVDGGTMETIFLFEGGQNNSNDYFMDDGDGPLTQENPLTEVSGGINDGRTLTRADVATGALATYTDAINGLGNTLMLQVSRGGDFSSTNEGFAFDNIVITAVPEPSSLAFLGIAACVATAKRRRRR